MQRELLVLVFLKKHFNQLRDKKIIVFAVGASPYDDKVMAELKERNLKEWIGQSAGFLL